MKKSVVLWVFVLLMTAAFSACSGGGGGGVPAVPAAPANVSITAGDGRVTLSWDAVAGADSYDLYWKTSPGVTITDAVIEGVTSPYVLTGLANGTACYCAITAINAAGESILSAEVTATPQTPPPAAPVDVSASAAYGQVTITWSPAAGASSYNIYWSTASGVTKTTGTKLANVLSPYAHSGLTNGTTYYYVVTAANAGGETPESAEVSATPLAVAPGAPSGVSAAAGDGQVTVTWSPAAGASTYNLYWSTAPGVTKATGTKLAAVSSPYTHTGLTNSTAYYYVVTAENPAGEGPESAQVSATPQVFLKSIAVTPETQTIATGGTQQFTAMGTYSDGSMQDLTTSAAWSSSDNTRATVNAAGLATAASHAAGSATITATSGSISGSAVLKVIVNLPRTGQTKCYDAAGLVIACTGTGQDGALQVGVVWPNPRFTDNGDGTVTDNLTGLIWLKDANCIFTSYPTFDADATAGDGRVTWQHALDFIAGINAGTFPNCGGGRTDWRMPNKNELMSLVDTSRSNPALPSVHPFTNVAITLSYWSSTTDAGDTTRAWQLATYYGSWMRDTKTGNTCAWPVRDAAITAAISLPQSGQTKCYDAAGLVIDCAGTGQDGALQTGVSLPNPRFTDNSDGTVTDNLTGLIWLKDANCIATNYPTFDADGAVDWQIALDFVSGINAGTYSNCGGGHTDWRLPSVFELESLVDVSKSNLALTTGYPFTNMQPGYWSSTSYIAFAHYGWYVEMDSGRTTGSEKTGTFKHSVWPVRSGL